MNGLVLAGGHSRRMGRPKSLLAYHSVPQYQHAVGLLAPYCEQVFISCRAEQQALFAGYPTILDTPLYGDIGPLNGVLSAVAASPATAWLVLGCDYPFLELSDIQQLIAARNLHTLATVFANPETGKPEPLLGIYEAEVTQLLFDWFNLGNTSLRMLLEKQPVQLVAASHPLHLQSVDKPGDYEKYSII